MGFEERWIAIGWVFFSPERDLPPDLRSEVLTMALRLTCDDDIEDSYTVNMVETPFLDMSNANIFLWWFIRVLVITGGMVAVEQAVILSALSQFKPNRDIQLNWSESSL